MSTCIIDKSKCTSPNIFSGIGDPIFKSYNGAFYFQQESSSMWIYIGKWILITKKTNISRPAFSVSKEVVDDYAEFTVQNITSEPLSINFAIGSLSLGTGSDTYSLTTEAGSNAAGTVINPGESETLYTNFSDTTVTAINYTVESNDNVGDQVFTFPL